MRCQRQPVIVWTGVTDSIITKSRNDDVPRTLAVDAETFATEPGRPRTSEMISGAMNTKGMTRSPRKNHTPNAGSRRFAVRARELVAASRTATARGASVGLVPAVEAGLSRRSLLAVVARVPSSEMVRTPPARFLHLPCCRRSERAERYHGRCDRTIMVERLKRPLGAACC